MGVFVCVCVWMYPCECLTEGSMMVCVCGSHSWATNIRKNKRVRRATTGHSATVCVSMYMYVCPCLCGAAPVCVCVCVTGEGGGEEEGSSIEMDRCCGSYAATSRSWRLRVRRRLVCV